jgi:hypothetical protein
MKRRAFITLRGVQRRKIAATALNSRSLSIEAAFKPPTAEFLFPFRDRDLLNIDRWEMK